MANLATATLQVNFAEPSLNGKIVLQQVQKRFGSEGELRVRCYPATGITFVASVGKVIQKSVYSSNHTEAIKFSNSSSSALQFPGAYNVTINESNNVTMEEVVDDLGNRIIQPTTAVSLDFDATTNSIVATDALGRAKPIHGGCFVAYKALYRLLYYFPAVNAPFGGAYGMSFAIGPIYAYTNQTVEVLDIELDMSSQPDWVEFARVTSKIVLDQRGTWEFPDNWNSTYTSNKGKNPDQKSAYTTGTYNLGSDEIDPDACFVDTRVHTIVYITTTGDLRYEDFNNGGDDYWAWFNPYFGYSTYDPIYELTWSDPPGGQKSNSAADFEYDQNHTTWRDVFLIPNKAKILERLQKEYPGVTAGSKVRQ